MHRIVYSDCTFISFARGTEFKNPAAAAFVNLRTAPIAYVYYPPTFWTARPETASVQADILHTHLYISSNLASLKEELPHYKSGSAVPTAPPLPHRFPPVSIPAVPVLHVPVLHVPVLHVPVPAALIPTVPVPAALLPAVQIPPAPVSALREDALIILRTWSGVIS